MKYVVVMAHGANAETVCRMAADFYRLRNQSMLDLLKSSGYLLNHDGVTVAGLEEVFKTKPELIEPWYILSEDQRTPCGYYLLPPGAAPNRSVDWVVGYYPGGKEQHFPDGPTACAQFVKFEVENLRYIAEGGPPIKTR